MLGGCRKKVSYDSCLGRMLDLKLSENGKKSY